ncbi:unnamed protein product [Rhizoctonia solani]|uniref:DUF7918 domain-containing protein n=1 Tax=Rhizoctonia solani TaxID=456999 RepID=A0A8H2XG76_9AGAM|nr:unnamed protein product [Rhizoctonia solani]
MIFEKSGLSVWITDSDGDKLPEYEVQVTSYDTIQCWIPSTEGSNFEIHFEVRKNPHPIYGISTSPFLDGVEMTGNVLSRSDLRNGVCTGVHDRESTGTTTARLYEFGKRTLTDSDDCPELDSSLVESLNTIKLKFEWGRSGKSSRAKFNSPQELEVGPIHEKVAKKGHSDAAKLGKTITTIPVLKGCSFTVYEEIDPITFVFRYAPSDWLQAQGIIQLSPRPEPQGARGAQKRAHSTPDVIDVDELETDDEIQIIKHMIPAPTTSNKKQRTSGQEDTTNPKKEEN